MKPIRILFLCTGNYYRSRLAEILFNHFIGKYPEIQAASRGLAVELGSGNIGPLSPEVICRLESRNIPWKEYNRFPIQVTQEDLKQADWIIAMNEREHRSYVQERFPSWTDRIEYWQIPDLDILPAEQGMARIEQSVSLMIGRIQSDSGEPDEK